MTVNYCPKTKTLLSTNPSDTEIMKDVLYICIRIALVPELLRFQGLEEDFFGIISKASF
jgi:hypothetical protein